MDASKDFRKEQGWMPRISFKKTPKVTVKLISDEKRKITDNTGEDVEGIVYKVEQDGEEKEIFTSSMSLISQLADLKPGDSVEIEMKTVKAKEGYRVSFSVCLVGQEKKGKGDKEEIDPKDIPF